MANWVSLIGLGLIAFLLTWLSLFPLRRWLLRWNIVDAPGKRSLHQSPTPRSGGLSIVAMFYLAIVAAHFAFGVDGPGFWALLMTALAIAALGFADDLYDVPRRVRFVTWIVIAAVAMLFGIRLTHIVLPLIGRIEFGWFSYPLTFVWLIGVTNFYNFMDGIDGLAGGEAVIVGAFLAAIAFASGNGFVAVTSLLIAAGALGFLLHNFPPARIFMGDGGSNFLGYLFAALGVMGAEYGSPPVPFVVPVLLLGMFLFDATVVLFKHLPRGKNWLEPHRDHYYQRLVLLGYTHLQVTLLYWTGSFLLGLFALAYLATSGWLALLPLLASGLLFLTVILGVNFLERRQKYSDRRLT
jgi:UDP-GlcNAc:undecaprenyl-phosphate GlcNAc-1-phosphate transferase